MTNCSICLEEIEGNGIELPECGHECFHANCIMQWFRSGNKRCPVCNDKGANDGSFEVYGNERIKIAKRYYRKGKTDPITSKLIESLLENEKKLEAVKKLISEHRKSTGVFQDLIKKQRTLYTKEWKCKAKINDLKKSISGSFNCVKMILVTKRKI